MVNWEEAELQCNDISTANEKKILSVKENYKMDFLQ